MVDNADNDRQTQTTIVEFTTVPLEDESTLPEGEPSAGARSTLSGSMQSDVARFLGSPGTTELLPVMAASVRHLQPITMILSQGHREWRLSIDPRAQTYRSEFDVLALEHRAFRNLCLRRVDEGGAVTAPHRTIVEGQLSDLLWRAAMVGNRDKILPEISGRVRYRTAGTFRPGSDPIAPTLVPVLARLSRSPATLAELQRIAADKLAPQRLLNSLYLQSALIVTRAGPAGPRNLGLLWMQEP